MTIRLLIADGSTVFLKALVEYLREHEEFLIVGTARRGREALRLAMDTRPDVVLLDLRLPDMPGLTLVQKIKAELPSTGIVAMVLFDYDIMRMYALAAGADDYVPKKHIAAKLLPCIRRLRSAAASDKAGALEGG